MLIFCYDVESNGLYGEGFAFGAVVMDAEGRELDTAQLCCTKNVTDSWVKENCLPFLGDIPQAATTREVRRSFWQFYMKWKDRCHIFADVIYPVDANFMRDCALENDGQKHAPFPLLDIAAITFALGGDSLADGEDCAGITGNKHHPLYDARVSAHKLLRLIRKNKLILPPK